MSSFIDLPNSFSPIRVFANILTIPPPPPPPTPGSRRLTKKLLLLSTLLDSAPGKFPGFKKNKRKLAKLLSVFSDGKASNIRKKLGKKLKRKRVIKGKYAAGRSGRFMNRRQIRKFIRGTPFKTLPARQLTRAKIRHLLRKYKKGPKRFTHRDVTAILRAAKRRASRLALRQAKAKLVQAQAKAKLIQAQNKAKVIQAPKKK